MVFLVWVVIFGLRVFFWVVGDIGILVWDFVFWSCLILRVFGLDVEVVVVVVICLVVVDMVYCWYLREL